MKNIYVGNLDFRTTETDLRKQFEIYGPIDRVNMITDKDTGQPKGFAFIEMTNDPDGEKAIAGLNGTQVDGRALNVNEARPKTERGQSGRGGGRSRY